MAFYTFRFFHDQLPDDTWRGFYNIAEAAIASCAPSVRFPRIPGSTIRDYVRVLEYVYNDHPDFFYFFALGCTWNLGPVLVDAHLAYLDKPADIRRKAADLTAKGRAILSACFPKGLEHYSKLALEKGIFDYITRNVVYDHHTLDQVENHGGPLGDAWNAYGALVLGSAVCHGIACAFKLLCDMVGMPSIVVTGQAKERHAWNIVRISDRFYNVDCTWVLKEGANLKIPYKRYQYYNVPDIVFHRSHTPEMDFLPRCASLRYNPFRQKGLCAFDEQDLARILDEQLSAGLERFAVMCVNGRPEDEVVTPMVSNAAKKHGKDITYFRDGDKTYLGIVVEN